VKTICLLALLASLAGSATGQNSTDSAQQKQVSASADDPSQFFTRIELFNELQHYKDDVYFNQTVLRTNVKIGKRFTTRIDIPFIYNSRVTINDVKHSGIGDISFRLLGYKFIENPISVVTASLEISLNTAESPLLGTGKTLLTPLISYSRIFRSKKIIFAAIFQQTNSVGGNQTRSDVSFSKIQTVILKAWTRKMWTYMAPEWYIDYVKGGLSMNLKSRIVTAPFPRLNLFATAGAGIFGDFITRFQWSGEVGCRYYLFKNKPK
jgi:hypothetical protein